MGVVKISRHQSTTIAENGMTLYKQLLEMGVNSKKPLRITLGLKVNVKVKNMASHTLQFEESEFTSPIAIIWSLVLRSRNRSRLEPE